MKTIILAAGQGKRMYSKMQKVLHPLLGKPIVRYAVEAALEAGISDITVVVGRDGFDIEKELRGVYTGMYFAVQEEPLGTGHAVKAGAHRVMPEDDVLILYGDMPLVTGDFIREFSGLYQSSSCDALVAAAYHPEMNDFGRVYDENGNFLEIVESRDLRPSHAQTDWVNTGICLFKGTALLHGLSRMTNNNSQNEFYLTDVPKILRDAGGVVRVFHSRADFSVFTGINTQNQLAEAARHMRGRINAGHMARGVRMIDPASVFIDSAVEIAPGAVIYPGCILEGTCKIAEETVIGPNTHMIDTETGAGVHVRQSVTNGAKIGAGTEVGPFAYLRPGTVIGEKCRVGNFVEVKNAVLGNETKMAHLAYIGDADVGDGVNFSCGAITCNYDGEKKHRTIIKDGAFIGSNVNLVAPVTIGENAFAAAGSTITDDLPPDALGIARARQQSKAGWRVPEERLF